MGTLCCQAHKRKCARSEEFETFAEKQSFVGAFAVFVKLHDIYFD